MLKINGGIPLPVSRVVDGRVVDASGFDPKVFKSKDEKEIIQMLEDFILRRLIKLSNRYENYMRAIDEVQLWLVKVVESCGGRITMRKKKLMEDAANRAGEKFLLCVGDAKLQSGIAKLNKTKSFLSGKFCVGDGDNGGSREDLQDWSGL